VLLPYKPFTAFEALAKAAGFFAEQVVHVKQSETHDYFRSIGIFSRKEQTPAVSTMAIRDAGHKEYTEGFKMLLKPYYLYL
jgi:tRNA1Val (adenine37-N6)-methyltransferase